MDRIDRLMAKATLKPTLEQCMEKDNPYMGKPSNELLGYLNGDNYCAPEMGTAEWDKFMHALVRAESVGELTE